MAKLSKHQIDVLNLVAERWRMLENIPPRVNAKTRLPSGRVVGHPTICALVMRGYLTPKDGFKLPEPRPMRATAKGLAAVADL